MSTKTSKLPPQPTNNFVSMQAATEALELQGVHPLEIGHYIATGKVTVGKPNYGRHQRLIVQDGRYFIKA